jgi:hypothetical protein
VNKVRNSDIHVFKMSRVRQQADHSHAGRARGLNAYR